MTDQKLVDELEKALRDEAYDGGFGYMGDEQFTAYVRTLAATAAEVVEKAHAPTDDEGEAMRRIIAEGSYSRSNDDLPYQDVAERLVAAGFGFRRTEVPEPSVDEEALAGEIGRHKLVHVAVSRKSAFCMCSPSVRSGTDENIAWFEKHRARAVAEWLKEQGL